MPVAMEGLVAFRRTAGAGSGTGKTEVITRAGGCGGPLHQMLRRIVIHRFYVYPLIRDSVFCNGRNNRGDDPVGSEDTCQRISRR